MATSLRATRSILNVAASLVQTVMVSAVGFLATPRLLAWLGHEKYGAFNAVNQWYAYVLLLEFGLGGALSPLLAHALAQTDPDAVRRTLAAGIRAYGRILFLMLAGGAILAWLIPYLILVSPAARTDLRMGCLLAVVGVLLVPLAPFRALVEAEQRTYVVSLLLVGQSLLITGLALWWAYRGLGITGQFLAVLLGSFFFHAALAAPYLDRRLLQALRLTPERALNQRLWKLSGLTFVFNIAGRLSILSDNIVVAALLGPAQVVPFFLTQRLPLFAQTQLQSLGGGTWAAMAELHFTGQLTLFRQRLLEITRLVAVLATAVLVPIVLFNRVFVTLWVGRTQFGGGELSLLAVLDAFFLALTTWWGWIFTGTGRVGRLLPQQVTGAVVNLAASIILTYTYGLIGPLLGTLIMYVAVSVPFLLWLLWRDFGLAPVSLLAASALPVIFAVFFLTVFVWATGGWQPTGWSSLVLRFTLVGAVFLSAAWFVLFSRSERNLWQSSLQRALRQARTRLSMA